MTFTVGHYLGERFKQIGLKKHFAVAGDYNLILLDQLIESCGAESQIYSCNELNCSFSAEGYAREHGIAAAVVTFSVGAISAMNGIGSAYAENVPVILVSGAPNTNDLGSDHILHHTIGTTNYQYQQEMLKHITCATEHIVSAQSAPERIDRVIRAALCERKPVYLEIACNVSAQPCARPGPLSQLLTPPSVDEKSMHKAIEASLHFIEQRKKIVILVGGKVRSAHAIEQTVALADALGCAVAVMGQAKSFFPETHPGFRGIYWGEISSPSTQALVEDADGVIALGPVWNDYSSVGWRALVRGKRVIEVQAEHTQVGETVYSGFGLRDCIKALIPKVPKRTETCQNKYTPYNVVAATDPDSALTNDEMCRQINALIDGRTTLFAETGDSWFNALRMQLPKGAKVETEMQWGHIGWSIPAVHGAALAAPDRRHIVMVGDGSFQFTAQEVSQMIRMKLPIIIFLINNRGYVIEIKIHDGPYNYIQNWNYAGLMEVFNGKKSDSQDIHSKDFGHHGLGLKAHTGAELAAAIEKAKAHTQGPTLIECVIEREDCTDLLVRWGKAVAQTNARKPQPQYPTL